MGYIRRSSRLHKDRGLPDLSSAPINYISLMRDADQKWEQVPNRREVIHDAMFHHMLKLLQSSRDDNMDAVATDWLLLGRYTSFCKSKWCQNLPTSFVRITDPLWGDRSDSVAVIVEDFTLKDANGRRLAITLDTPPSARDLVIPSLLPRLGHPVHSQTGVAPTVPSVASNRYCGRFS
eukprot:CCRYP_011968-RA/>CCRYP_011968-RA protein AED:0.87 eAED:0.88 QI:0/0/0/1/1/1/2/0/177